MRAHRTLTLAIAALLSVAVAADQADVKRVQEWRAKHEADYTREWVPLSGLFVLKPGVNTVGSGAGNDVGLPSRAPAPAGRFVYENQRVRFEPVRQAGGRTGRPDEWPVTLNGKPSTASTEVFADPDAPRMELAIGDMTFWVHYSGDRRFIRLRDPQSVQAKSFKGFTWFPID